MKLKHFSPFLFIFIILFLFSCSNNRKKNTINNRTSVKVVSYPKGKISSHSDITVTFSKPLTIKGNNVQNKFKDIFLFSPKIEGKTYRSGENSITFQPDKPFAYGTGYHITIDLTKLFDHPENDKFSFDIITLPLMVNIGNMTFTPAKTEQPKINNGIINLNFSDVVNTKYLKQALTITQNSNNLPFTLDYNKSPENITVNIDSIHRTKTQSKVLISIDLKKLSGNGTKTWDFPVNALNKFTFNNWKLIKEKENAVELYFSDPIDQNQNLKGLIYFKDGSQIKTSVKNNIVTVYPQEKPTGNKTIIISSAVKNYRGADLGKKQQIIIYFKPISPKAVFYGNGSIIVTKNIVTIPFKTINLNAVDVIIFKIFANNVQQFLQVNDLNGDYQIQRVGKLIHYEKIILHNSISNIPNNQWENYAIDLSKMIHAESGAIYRIFLRFKKGYTMMSCNNSKEQNKNIENKTTNNRYYYDDYYYPPDYKWSESDNFCSDSYYYYEHFNQKNVIASNIGLTVKKIDKNKYAIFANDMITGNPLKGVKIMLFSYQQQKLADGTTDSQGFVLLDINEKAALLIAHKDNSYSYLKLHGGNVLSYSKFDTKGVETENEIKGYIYGERGVWRPGDTLFLNFILRDKQNTLPNGHPLTFKIFNARNKLVFSETRHKSSSNIYSFKIVTQKDEPTGIWMANVKIGGNTFTKRLRIEDIKPNHLKIKLSIGDNKIITRHNTDSGHISTQWLNGGTAYMLKAIITESITNAKTKFEKFKNYIFNDPSKRFYPDESTVFNDKLNKEGKASFDIYKPTGSELPSMLRINFTAKVFEPGGGFSINQKAWNYTPYSSFIGIKVPQSANENKWLQTDKNQKFDIVCIDANGNPIKKTKLTVEIYHLDWSWWYQSNEDIASYISKNYNHKIFTKNINVIDGKAHFVFNLKYPNWGNFFIKVIDNNSRNSTGVKVYFDWPSSYSRKNRKTLGGATILNLSTEKDKYKVDETVKVSFPAPKNSKILVSLEKNNRQLKWWWADSKEGKNIIEFKTTKDMTPNIYVYISVIQPHGQTVNDLPTRMYGIIPITVEDPDTKLIPELQVPKSIHPQAKYKISISEKNGKNMEYTIAVVDEGLLDLTNFKTPDPYSYFFSKEALAIKTWDIYDDVIGAFGGRLLQQFAVGGGEELNNIAQKKVNRFKPVVHVLGPFKLKKGQTATHLLKMDNYVGAVRIMVVAANNSAYGKAEKSVQVKQPLMVLTTLPRILAPGEKLQLPVTIFAMKKSIKKVSVTIKTNDIFRITKNSKSVEFEHPGEKMTFFNISTKKIQGIGKVWVTVSSGNEKAFYNISINIRNPNKRQYKTANYRIAKGEKWRGQPQFIGMKDTRKCNMSISTLTPINLEWRLKYLIRYPYGCIEQTVSSAFPQLYLDKLTQLNSKQKDDIDNNISATINKLTRFQTTSGGFTYWIGLSTENDWGSSYAGHFLLLAKDKGYFVPSDMISKWIYFQQKKANEWTANYYNNYLINDLNQAYRLYTLALAGKPNMAAMNRLLETNGLSITAKYSLAAAYALINQSKVAVKLISSNSSQPTPDNFEYRNNFGSNLRNEAIMLQTYTLLKKQNEAFQLFKKIASQLGSNIWLSTQSTAFGLYAVAQYIGVDVKTDKTIEFNWNWLGKTSHQKSDKNMITIPLKVNNGELTIENLTQNDIFLTLTSSGIPLVGKKIKQSNNLALKVVYRNMENKIITVDSLKQGIDFYVDITITNPGTLNDYDHLALTFPVPSGWEIINTRLWNIGSSYHSSRPDYFDIRDDRVNLFFNLKFNEKKHFVILLNAAYAGTFFAPQITCEEMYNHSIKAVTGGGTVTVNR